MALHANNAWWCPWVGSFVLVGRDLYSMFSWEVGKDLPSAKSCKEPVQMGMHVLQVS